jgi:CubicO group peptidase (beta-lactamase class C family)
VGITAEALQASLEEGLARHHVAGASLALLHNGEVTTAAAGVTNVNTRVELTADTAMHIGSITKLFTATLVMQLVDEGRVGLDDPVVRHLPDLELKSRVALERITVRMLLDHTSGIDGEMLPDHGHDEETLEKAIARFRNFGQRHPPGREFSYSNAGMVLAGYLAQKVAATSWYRLVRERVFEPLQMEHSATLPQEALLHRASVGHHFDTASGKLIRVSNAFLPLSYAPAGTTLMTSARNLVEFARAHMNGGVGSNGSRILSTCSAEAMQRLSVNNHGKGYTYGLDMGLGWMIADDGLIHHAGGGPGTASVLYAYPKQQWAVALLTNTGQGLNLINELMEPWLKERGTAKPLGMIDIRLPSQSVEVQSARYVGTYEELVLRFRVLTTSRGLAVCRQARFASNDYDAMAETPPEHLIPLGDDQFLSQPDPQQGELPDAYRIFAFRNTGADGRMQHLGWGGRLYPRVASEP